jgi:hypothetical protein
VSTQSRRHRRCRCPDSPRTSVHRFRVRDATIRRQVWLPPHETDIVLPVVFWSSKAYAKSFGLLLMKKSTGCADPRRFLAYLIGIQRSCIRRQCGKIVVIHYIDLLRVNVYSRTTSLRLLSDSALSWTSQDATIKLEIDKQLQINMAMVYNQPVPPCFPPMHFSVRHSNQRQLTY